VASSIRGARAVSDAGMATSFGANTAMASIKTNRVMIAPFAGVDDLNRDLPESPDFVVGVTGGAKWFDDVALEFWQITRNEIRG
jgi:hypothetical protein